VSCTLAWRVGCLNRAEGDTFCPGDCLSFDPFRIRLATILQQQLAEAGIQVTVSSYDWGTFFGDIKAGRFQLYSLAWVGIKSPDIFRYAFHSDALPPAGANRGRFSDVQVDHLIDAAMQQVNPQRQAGLIDCYSSVCWSNCRMSRCGLKVSTLWLVMRLQLIVWLQTVTLMHLSRLSNSPDALL